MSVNNRHRFLLNAALHPVEIGLLLFETVDIVQANKSEQRNSEQKNFRVESEKTKKREEQYAYVKDGRNERVGEGAVLVHK